ncbi:uncharacterized protein LOC125042351 isoform X1 [Penaeus chinensis]|uniref:uncharacterized protein LOC125042351 isoform X1 n=1 Tax=Penaeus chinensis TaxID=139456 RepID=UPI001FB57A2F|nr:uncharacterized protein LOC125042351 isoform X1 [Penaeus chinensis]
MASRRTSGGNLCCLPLCRSRKHLDSNLHFHRFPSNSELSKTWLKFVNRPDLNRKTCKELNNTYKVCSRHFAPDMYMSPISPRLKHSAVPTIPVQEKVSQCGTLSVESTVAVPSPKIDTPDASSKICAIATECVEESDGPLQIFIPSTDSEKGSSRDSMAAESLDDWGYFDGGGGNDPLEVTSFSSDMPKEEANNHENTSRVFCSADFSTPEGMVIKPNTSQHQDSGVLDKLNGEIAPEFIEVKDEPLDDWRDVGDCNTQEESGDLHNDLLCSQERDAHGESVKAEPLDSWKDIDEYNDDNRLLQVKEELDGKDDDQFYRTIFEMTGSRANALSVVSDRGRIIGLWEAGKSKVEISRQLGVHRTTVHKWIKRWRQEGSLKTKHRCGRPQVTSQKQNRAIVERALARPLTPAVKLTKELKLPCSVWTVRRRLHAAGKPGADRKGGAIS